MYNKFLYLWLNQNLKKLLAWLAIAKNKTFNLFKANNTIQQDISFVYRGIHFASNFR